eukprot:CAMPEP_0181256212 /NCGR_PEP_ID=MMETSP1096-20121128/49583_1 /TAXON_ID=156174 ORGANISM="Chrysochromulina ericina, Strain CCMP281" /NCGR_SAMPLE_ID=MMETSP1096 /ASSEMBLY_ACC=CAM_ASM_000453 /LENGTH=374 /DNA_ID=CAMNT_0023354433 /DNA_START=457 /DNA_END=1581 /DNA_ORIENTATION=+
MTGACSKRQSGTRRRRSSRIPPPSQPEPHLQAVLPPAQPEPSFELPPRAQLLPDYQSPSAAAEVGAACALTSARSTSDEERASRRAALASRRAARAARLQKRRDELDLDMVDEDEQESQAWWDAEHNTELGTELGAAAELLEAELSRKDADFDGSEAEWQRLDHDEQILHVLDAAERRRSGRVKLEASKAEHAKQLNDVLKLLSIRQLYALYPSHERPEYQSIDFCDRGRHRPAEDKCACGKHSRYQCRSRKAGAERGCEDPPLVYLAARLEREQDGQVSEYADRGLLLGPKGLFHTHFAPFAHEKCMHLADRLCRSGMLVLAKHEHALAMFRRVSAADLIAAWDVEPPPLMQDTLCKTLGVDSSCARSKLFFY